MFLNDLDKNIFLLFLYSIFQFCWVFIKNRSIVLFLVMQSFGKLSTVYS